MSAGIVSNEFFDANLGRMGGFGWVAREAARCLRDDSDGSINPVFLTGEHLWSGGHRDVRSDGVPVVSMRRHWAEYVCDVSAHRPDALLTIDYRPSYDPVLAAAVPAPVIIWVQDPRPPEDIEKVSSLRIPGDETELAQGIEPIDCTGLDVVVGRLEADGRTVLFASPAPQLIHKMAGTFGMTPSELVFLPYPLQVDSADREAIVKASRPLVIFLGRLDPIKRPWLFLEVARHHPDVDFVFMGQSHFRGAGAWAPSSVPDNVRFVGHVGGEEKTRLLASAWMLINTSIHEALPVSFLEALLFETPIIGCQNPEDVAARFGVYTGRWDGSGLAAVPAFSEGVQRLLEDPELRVRLGRAGRAWVEEHHGRRRFLSTFLDLCAQAGARGSTVKLTGTSPSTVPLPPPEPWGLDDSARELQATIATLSGIVSGVSSFILVDDDEWGADVAPGCRVLPFLEKGGHYWGPPADDQTAIGELGRLRPAGAELIVFGRPAFWWLEHYSEFHAYLRRSFPCIAENERLIVFDLRPDAARQS